jgi:hypothetical protein
LFLSFFASGDGSEKEKRQTGKCGKLKANNRKGTMDNPNIVTLKLTRDEAYRIEAMVKLVHDQAKADKYSEDVAILSDIREHIHIQLGK